jgi:hydroxyacyl-ACP dehydratase HTD2-like protein with hotdog domain
VLVRHRANAADTVTLQRRAPGEYAGMGLFYAPLRCKRRIFTKGELVPYTLDLHITAAQVFANVDTATAITATYTNRARVNLTPCVVAPSHDAARYDGHLVAPPSGGAGP